MKTKVTAFIWLMLLLVVQSVSAGDLNDGISNYTDDKISAADQLGSAGVNFSFIEMQAMSRVGAALYNTSPSSILDKTTGYVDSTLDGFGNSGGSINSVTLYPGATVYGDIIIVDTSTGSKTQVVFGDRTFNSSVGSDLDNISETMDELDKLVD
ncbi:MAG: hypothetical protein ABFS19_08135 [Thermodesulfobacteriota bacterium]